MNNSNLWSLNFNKNLPHSKNNKEDTLKSTEIISHLIKKLKDWTIFWEITTMKFNLTSPKSTIFNKLLMNTETLKLKLKISNIKSSCLLNKLKDSINLSIKRMDSLLISKKINSISILKSTITNLMSKKSNNPKVTLESTNNKLIILKKNWMDGKEKLKKLMPRLKELKVNFSNMLKKKIVYQICWKQKIMSMKLWEDHWQTMKLKPEKYNICKLLAKNLM